MEVTVPKGKGVEEFLESIFYEKVADKVASKVMERPEETGFGATSEK